MYSTFSISFLIYLIAFPFCSGASPSLPSPVGCFPLHFTELFKLQNVKMLSYFLGSYLSLLVSWSLYLSPCLSQSMPTVTLSSGPVVGTTTSVPYATATTNKFLGVPFAITPPERFSPPEPLPGSSQPIMAQALKAACIQQFVCKVFQFEGSKRLRLNLQTRKQIAPSPWTFLTTQVVQCLRSLRIVYI